MQVVAVVVEKVQLEVQEQVALEAVAMALIQVVAAHLHLLQPLVQQIEVAVAVVVLEVAVMDNRVVQA
jgi:hypothetical protein